MPIFRIDWDGACSRRIENFGKAPQFRVLLSKCVGFQEHDPAVSPLAWSVEETDA